MVNMQKISCIVVLICLHILCLLAEDHDFKTYENFTEDGTPVVDMNLVHDGKTFDTYDLHPRKFILPKMVQMKEGNEWWQVQYTAHKIFDSIRKKRLYLRRVEIDTNMIHSCYEYKLVYSTRNVDVIVDSSSFCYPAIVITGVPKCSTSAMFALLASPPFIISNPMKENCMFLTGVGILDYFASLPKAIPPNHYHIDGCIDVVGNMIVRNMLRNPNTFYIVMVRNFVDMAWSAYNYWCDPDVDKKCNRGNLWAEPAHHHRSPEHFHQIVMANVNVSKGLPGYVVGPHRVKNPCDLARNIYSHYISFLHEHAPLESTMVVASEELERNPVSVWKRLVEKSGIPAKPEPNFKSFTKVRFNTQVQGERGADVTVEAHTYTPGIYTISGNKPLLGDSRTILDKCWHNDCMTVSKLADYQYDACKDAPTVTKSTGVIKKQSLEVPDAVNSNLNLDGYLNSKLSKCMAQYVTKSAHTNQQVKKRFGNKNNGPVYSNQVLIVLEKIYERAFISGILKFALGRDAVLDVSEKASHEFSHNGQSAACSMASVVLADSHLLESINLKDSSTVPDRQRKVWLRFKDAPDKVNPCPNIHFSRIVFTSVDIFENIWKFYLQTYYGTNSYGTIEFKGNTSDWADWDYNAIDVVKEKNITSILALSGDIAHMHALAKQDMLVIITSDLLFSSKKFVALRKLMAFVAPEKYRDRANFGELECLFSLAYAFYLNLKDSYGYRHLIHGAFDSKGLLCAVQESLAHLPNPEYISYPRAFACPERHDLQLRAYTPTAFNTKSTALVMNQKTKYSTPAYDNSSPVMDSWVCDAKYNRRGYIFSELKTHVVPLVAEYNRETMNTRLLFEYATSLLTGAVASNNGWLSIFKGEFACGQRLGIVHLKWTSRTIVHKSRGETPSIRLVISAKRKCIRGMIRGFSKAILLLKDPYLTIWEDYIKLRYLTKYNNTELMNTIDIKDWSDAALDFANKFTESDLNLQNVYRDMSNIFDKDHVFAVTHEALTYVSTNQENRINNRYDTLMQMITFAGRENFTTPEKVHCAYSFLNLKSELEDMDTMVSFYQRANGLICEIRNIIEDKFKSVIKIHHIFHSVVC